MFRLFRSEVVVVVVLVVVVLTSKSWCNISPAHLPSGVDIGLYKGFEGHYKVVEGSFEGPYKVFESSFEGPSRRSQSDPKTPLKAAVSSKT